jgi:hypothetical protein
VSKPLEYEDSIALLRSSLDQLEKIAIHSSLPGANSKMTTAVIKSPPPPVPPKPKLQHQKPIVPPKPKKIINNSTKRSRGNSVSFAENLQQTAIIQNDQSLNILTKSPPPLTINTTTKQIFEEYKVAEEVEEEDDDDDDDVIIEFESGNIMK